MNVRLRYDLNFTAGIFVNGEMNMNQYSLRLWMATNCIEPDNQNIAYERIKYFVYRELNSTIFVNQDDAEQCQHYINAGLKITTMPGDPVDQLIGIMLYYKLNAIVEQRMVIVETEINSLLGDGMTYLHDSTENVDSVDVPGWWISSDPVHCENHLLTNNKVLELYHYNRWKDLDLSWPDVVNNNPDDNTVVFADFKKE